MSAGHNRELSDDIADDLKLYRVTFVHKRGEIIKQVLAHGTRQAEEIAWKEVDEKIDYDSVEIMEVN